MNPAPGIPAKSSPNLSAEGRARLLALRGEPLFLAAWERALFIHYEIDAGILQRQLPYELDLHEDKAFVSLVAFTMRGLRPRVGGKLAALLFKPIASHSFLNLRTYVKHRGERGICFISEWLSSRLSTTLGPAFYGLPYHFAKINYQHAHEKNFLRGEVRAAGGELIYDAKLAGHSGAPCEDNSLDQFLLERYTAFNWRGKSRLFFRVWHPPWPQVRAFVSVAESSLLATKFPWFAQAGLIGANYSAGFSEVWMGRAHRVG